MKTVAVVFGGRSVEHDISIITGQFIIAALEAAGHQPLPLYIARDGHWYSDASLAKIKAFKDPDFDQKLAKLKPINLSLGQGLVVATPGLRSKETKVDVVFPAMHGTYGEDGSLMGLLRLANVPFVGCDLEASVIAMDKVLTKQVTQAVGLMTVPYVWFTAEDWSKSEKRVRSEIETLKLPVFIKPAHLGSTIGISRVDKPEQLEQAIEVALHYDNKVIVEQGVTDLLEVNCAVLGNEKIQTSELEQPVAKAGLLSFDDKYMSGAKSDGGAYTGGTGGSVIPAPVEDEIQIKVKEMAVSAFKAIGGTGTSRLDFLIDKGTRDIYLNEINPLPGTLQQHLWKASGVSNVELVSRLVELAEQAHAERSRHSATFTSSVLNQSGGNKQISTD
ncbi:MAG TPA: D-alanine--D-alanine ligase family protein [Candidatus Nanoarchaeia archaeon]|nr:D-alanine--D-alanine ligase family protein [Candidatus Nanoarchaeia archaeon]